MTDTKNDPAQPKRPYATLDLKATEIKVTSIGEKSAAAASTTSSAATTSSAVSSSATPAPAPASTYAAFQASAYSATGSAKKEAASTKPSAASSGSPSTSTGATSSSASGTTAPQSAKPAAAAPSAPSATHQTVVVKKRGGFFSHLAASVIGGIVALAGADWVIPQLQQLGLQQYLPQLSATRGADGERLAKLEKQLVASDLSTQLKNAETRLAALEKTADAIPGIAQSQSRLVAETKAALASAASDAGAPDQIERLTKVEDKLKALTEAGANDPAAGRLEQLAALTGKVADLETSMATQLTALRKSVASDVEARIIAATEASEAAKSGTQRIDRELAGIKTDSARLNERLEAAKAEADRAMENLKQAQQDSATLKASLETLKSSVAKPSDVASAVTPVTEKLVTLEANLQNVLKSEEDRRSNAERIVLSLELQNLKRALDRGQKYGPELAEVQKASNGKLDLAALDKFKDQGVPTLPDLARDYRATANTLIDADADSAEGSVVDRLIAGAKSVVRVRKVSHNADDKSAEAIAGRMEIALKEGRLPDVIEEAKALSPKAKDAAAPFLEKVAARASVDSSVAQIETKLKSSLSGSATEPAKSQN